MTEAAAKRKAAKDAMTPEEKAVLEAKKAAAKATKAANTMIAPEPVSMSVAVPSAPVAMTEPSAHVKVKKVIALKKST